MKVLKKMICDEEVDVLVFGGKMRFYCEGSFYPMESTPEAPSHCFGVSQCPDGSFTVEMQKLVPYELDTEALEEVANEMLNNMELALRIPDGKLSSSMWLAGHSNESYDCLLQPEDLAYLNAHKEES